LLKKFRIDLGLHVNRRHLASLAHVGARVRGNLGLRGGGQKCRSVRALRALFELCAGCPPRAR
jgi:hypothetical protein